ncbi:hypothetical protein NGUA11_00053 [Salmonella enterica]|nr:hypothetical protein NGUA11_00053 [Salmonella enterica]
MDEQHGQKCRFINRHGDVHLFLDNAQTIQSHVKFTVMFYPDVIQSRMSDQLVKFQPVQGFLKMDTEGILEIDIKGFLQPFLAELYDLIGEFRNCTGNIILNGFDIVLTLDQTEFCRIQALQVGAFRPGTKECTELHFLQCCPFLLLIQEEHIFVFNIPAGMKNGEFGFAS